MSRLRPTPRGSLQPDAARNTFPRAIAAHHSANASLEALEATSCSIVITDATRRDNPIIYANGAFSVLSGYAEREVVGRNCRFLQGSDTDPQIIADLRAAVVAGDGIRREILNYRKDGTTFWNLLTIDPIRDAVGQLTGFIGVQQEADTAHLAVEGHAEAKAKLDSIADHIPGYIYRRVMRTDGNVEIEYCSPSLGTMLRMDAKEAARSFYDHIHPDDRELLMAAIRNSAIHLTIFREEFRLVSADGAVHWLRSDAPPRRMKNGETVWDGMAVEISAEKRWETEIANLALHDPLTRLLTREAWRQAITMQLAAGSSEAPHCGLLYIDVVAFRDLNHKLGQRAGDDILCEIARRLATIAASIGGVVARLGGDEFALLVPACSGKDALLGVANSSSDALARPMQINARSTSIKTCIGASLSVDRAGDEPSYTDVETEFRAQAEIALRQAKRAGSGSVVLYSAAQDDRFQGQTILAESLEHAIANNEMELHYQPLVDLASGRIVSAEALVRWHHPTLGMQWPDLFIPLAEKSGLIVQLGRWVFQQSLRQRKVWRTAGLALQSLAINVSVNQLREPGFIAFIEDSLKDLGANARDFEIELTEGLLIEPTPHILSSLHALRTMGFTITIDDFGSGHATFRYVRDFPVDKLKIDQVFVRQLVLGSTDALIIRAVISLAHGMGVRAVAEGIETEMQRDFLLSEGCQIGQGYFFSMPLVAEDFAWLLANDIRLPLREPLERSAAEKDIEATSNMRAAT